MEKKKSSIVINTLVMLIVTLVCVALLAVVNQVTKGPIEQAEINARAEVYKVVYPNAPAFGEVDGTAEMLEKSGEVLSSAGFDGCYAKDVLAVNDASGETVGYVIASVSPSGYGGDIQVAVGITKDGVLTGVDIVSNSETAGLGSKCTEPEFKNQFAGKPASTLEYTKTGATADNQIDAISGATITTNAVTEAVNAAIIFYQENFAGGIQAAEEKDPMEKAYPGVDLEALTDVELPNLSVDEDFTVNEIKSTGDGYIIVSTAHNGYDGDLQIALGIGNDGIIKGFATIVCNETKALGGQCTSDEFAQKFVGISADKDVTFVLSGANADNNEIDQIASATITTNAVTTAVNGAIKYYNIVKGA